MRTVCHPDAEGATRQHSHATFDPKEPRFVDPDPVYKKYAKGPRHKGGESVSKQGKRSPD